MEAYQMERGLPACTDAGALISTWGVIKRRQIADAILQTRVSAFRLQAGSPLFWVLDLARENGRQHKTPLREHGESFAKFEKARETCDSRLNQMTVAIFDSFFCLLNQPRALHPRLYAIAVLDSLKRMFKFINSSDQTESIKIGASGANQVTETYQYDNLNGLLTRQKVIKGGNNLLDLSYDYAKSNSVGTGTGKTGHLTKTTDNLNNAKNKEYEFDELGRLTKAKGGNNLWTQTYSYDRFGNRLNVVATGNGIDGQPMQKDGIGNLNFGATTDSSLTNRITTAGWEYDVAGNLTRGLD
jgi:hypothetical protein